MERLVYIASVYLAVGMVHQNKRKGIESSGLGCHFEERAGRAATYSREHIPVHGDVIDKC